MKGRDPPPGYRRIVVNGTEVVAITSILDTVCQALGAGTLHDFAVHHPSQVELAGRGVAYAIPLPGDGEHVVVRHNRHGGAVARLAGDRFLPPTRAPHELDVALRLRAGGVPTPEVVAYAIYRAGPLLRRSDVVTRYITPSRDLSFVLRDGSATERAAALAATAGLISVMSRLGARHHDLNVKNILLSDAGGTLRAIVLDVDRVRFEGAGRPEVVDANLARLARSVRKWRDRHGASVDESDLATLMSTVRSTVGGEMLASTRR